MSKEIEIKFQLEQNNLVILLNWLKTSTDFAGKKNITDHYFYNPNESFNKSDKYIDPLSFIRVREDGNLSYLCKKKRFLDKNKKTLFVEEDEKLINEKEKILNELLSDSKKSYVKIKKERNIYYYKESGLLFEIALDKVDELGDFIEIELKNPEKDSADRINKIYDLMKKIGITNFLQFDRGYLCMFLNPKINFAEKVDL